MSDWEKDWADSVDASLPKAATTAPASSSAGTLGYYTPADHFERSVNRTLQFEGGLNKRDTNGTPSKYGINAAANPDVDLSKLTKEGAKGLYKSRYWDTIGGDKLAQIDPNLAHVAFDTSVIAGPGKAKELLEASGGDAGKLLALRAQFQDHLLASDPAKYGPYTKTWADRVAGLGQDISSPQAPVQAPQTAVPDHAAALTQGFQDALAASLKAPTVTPTPVMTTPGVSSVQPMAPLPQGVQPQFGVMQNFMSAATPGGGMSVPAHAQTQQALWDRVAQAARGQGTFPTLQEAQETQSALQQHLPMEKAQWEGEGNTGKSLVSSFAGNLLPVAAGIGAGNALIGGAAKLAPEALTPAANFLMGTGGEGAGGVGGWVARRASDVAAGGIQGAVANTMTGENPLSGAAFGAGTGGLLGAAGARMLSAPSRVTMLPKTAEAAQRYGESLPVAALTGDKLVQALAGMGDREAVEQFNKKVLEETGATPFAEALGKKGIDSDVYKATKGALDAGYQDWGRQHQMSFDWMLKQGLQSTFAEAKRELGKSRPDAVKTLYDKMQGMIKTAQRDAAGNAFYSGQDFSSVTKPGGYLDDIYKADNKLTPYANKIKSLLRDALGRTDPEGLQQIQTLDKHWGNLRQLEPAISNLDDGLMSPQRIAQVMGKKTGDLADIADIGKYLPVPLASGGVKGKNGLGGLKLGGTLAGGSALGTLLADHGMGILHHVAEHPFAVGAGLAGAGAASAAKGAYGNWLRSPEYFNKVVGQSLAPTSHYAINPLTTLAPTWTQGQ